MKGGLGLKITRLNGYNKLKIMFAYWIFFCHPFKPIKHPLYEKKSLCPQIVGESKKPKFKKKLKWVWSNACIYTIAKTSVGTIKCSTFKVYI